MSRRDIQTQEAVILLISLVDANHRLQETRPVVRCRPSYKEMTQEPKAVTLPMYWTSIRNEMIPLNAI